MSQPGAPVAIPAHRDLFYGGAWHPPHGGHADTHDPARGSVITRCAEANAEDVDAAVSAAEAAFAPWRRMKPLERAAIVRRIAATLREHASELALLDSWNGGNPVAEMERDVLAAAAQLDYFAGLATELKGETIPMGGDAVDLTLREPFGVCARIVAYNHPLMFTAAKMGPPLIAGNTVIMKPPYQAPLSALRMMELIGGHAPPGVINLLTGGTPCGAALVAHPRVPRLSLIGSVETGRAIAKGAAERLKHVTLELGGKNACVIYPDADLARAIDGAVAGMNFTWCGQSCGSTSRLFVHDAVYERVLQGILERVRRYRPGLPTDPATTMGALVSKAQHDKVLSYVEVGRADGATLAYGGKVPDERALAGGWFDEPTIFTGVTQSMRIANEEVFGPVLSVLRWRDEDALWRDVNAVPYGLTCSIWTQGLSTAHRAAARAEAGFVWVNHIGQHFIGVPFGGVKQSGIGREESFDELLSYTQVKNVYIAL